MEIQPFFDPCTSTLSYLVHRDGIGVVIDPVLGFDPRSARTSRAPLEPIFRCAAGRGLRIAFALDTHAHADHLSGLDFFRRGFGAQTAIGWRIPEVQAVFARLYGLLPGFRADGSQFDRLLGDGEELDVGPFRLRALATPGHTPACMSYQIEDALFVGDTLFQPDAGTARCDFPEGSAEQLYDSIQRLYALPDATRVFTGHDYQPGGRALACESTIGEQKCCNVQLDERTGREEFVQFRKARDAGLEMPSLLWPALQVNIRGGRLPEPEANGRRYLRIPLDALGGR